MYLFFQANKTI